MAYNTILLDKAGHIARLTLNRSERLNALNEEMFAELNHALGDIAEDTGLRVLVKTGAGRAFCASADIKDESRRGGQLLGHKDCLLLFSQDRISISILKTKSSVAI